MKLTASLFFILSLTVSGLATTVPQVEADLTLIGNDVLTLNRAINGFANPGGTIPEAFAIQSAGQQVVTALKSATSDVQALTPRKLSEADAHNILGQLQKLAPNIITGLNAIQTKKSAFEALPIGGLVNVVEQDLVNLNASTGDFEAALLPKLPNDLQGPALTLAKAIGAAFAAAIAKYRS